MNEEIKQYIQPGKKNLILIYSLYLVGLMLPIIAVVGGAFAYANQGNSGKFLRSHYVFAVRSFYIGAIGYVISLITMLILIGPLVHALVLVWVIVRSVIALQYLIQEIPHPNPLTFWIK